MRWCALILIGGTLWGEVRIGLAGGTLPTSSIPFVGKKVKYVEYWRFGESWTSYVLKLEYAKWMKDYAVRAGIKGFKWGGPGGDDVCIYTLQGWFYPYFTLAPIPVYIGIEKPLTLNSSFQANFEACFWCLGDVDRYSANPYSYYEFTLGWHYYLGKISPKFSIGVDFSLNLGMRAYYYKWKWWEYDEGWFYTYFVSAGIELPMMRFSPAKILTVQEKPQLSLELLFEDPNNNGKLDAEETGYIVCKITNLKKRKTAGVKIKCRLLTKEFEEEIDMGKPKPSRIPYFKKWEKKIVKIPVTGAPHLHTGQITVKVQCIYLNKVIAERELFIITRGKSDIYKY